MMEHKRRGATGKQGLDTSHALVKAALAAVRAEPGVRAEMTSQEVLGSVLELGERRADWVRAKGEDGYEGWVNVGALQLVNTEDAETWRGGAGGEAALVLHASVLDSQERLIAVLPWGARIGIADGRALLPGGTSGRLASGEWISEAEVAERRPAGGAAVVAMALTWLGAPYLWGGRTRWGVDCSGFVQAVLRLHGITLPRDSRKQAGSGAAVEPGDGFAALSAGDLVFFRGEESDRVTHVAMSVGGARIIHSALPNGCVALNSLAGDAPLERSLAERVVAARRVLAG